MGLGSRGQRPRLVLGAGAHSAMLGLGAVKECAKRQGEESQDLVQVLDPVSITV